MDLSLEKLKEALSLREQIQALEERLSSLFGRGDTSAGRRDRRRRPMSAATRAKLAAAARERWAARRGKDGQAKTRRRRSGISAAGRKKLSDAMKARWAARRTASGAKKK